MFEPQVEVAVEQDEVDFEPQLEMVFEPQFEVEFEQ